MDTVEKQSLIVDWLKGILPIMVIAIHTSVAELNCWASIEQFMRFLICLLGRVAVPSFFIISGFFFYSKLDVWSWKIWGQKLKKRVRTLLLPYVLWIVVALIVRFIYSFLKADSVSLDFASFKDFFTSRGSFMMFFNRPIVERTMSLFRYYIPSGMPYVSPLWYIRDLFMMVLLSPLTHLLIKKVGAKWIMMLVLCYVLNIGIPFEGFSPCAFLFFSFGAYFAIKKESFIVFFNQYKNSAYIMSVTLLCAVLAIEATSLELLKVIIERCFVVVAVVSVFNLSDYLLSNRIVHTHRLLTESSFFVYAVHTVALMEVVNLILGYILPFENNFIGVLKVLLTPTMVWALSLAVFVLLKKTVPCMLNVLTGGRG